MSDGELHEISMLLGRYGAKLEAIAERQEHQGKVISETNEAVKTLQTAEAVRNAKTGIIASLVSASVTIGAWVWQNFQGGGHG